MKLYFELSDIYREGVVKEPPIVTDRIDLYYIFLVQYAIASIKSIISINGQGFVTFLPPQPMMILEQIRQFWSVEIKPGFILDLDNDWITGDVINFEKLHGVLFNVRMKLNVSVLDFSNGCHVSLCMSKIGGAVICVEYGENNEIHSEGLSDLTRGVGGR